MESLYSARWSHYSKQTCVRLIEYPNNLVALLSLSLSAVGTYIEPKNPRTDPIPAIILA